MYRLMLFACLIFGLTGCASLSQESCVAGDWYAIGERDGERGHSEDRYQDHAEACSEFGVGVNVADYMKGREAGLRLYCTPENAYQLGLRNDFYDEVCPAAVQSEFNKAYRKGRQTARLRCMQDYHYLRSHYFVHHPYGPYRHYYHWPSAYRTSVLDCY